MDDGAVGIARALDAGGGAAPNDTLANATDVMGPDPVASGTAAAAASTVNPLDHKWIEELWKKSGLTGSTWKPIVDLALYGKTTTTATSTARTTTTTSDPDYFRCGSLTISRGLVCDGYVDCYDESDERYDLCGDNPCDKVISFPKKCDDGRCNFAGRCDHSNLDQFGVFWYVVLGILILLLICCFRKCQKWLDTPSTQQQRPTLVSVPPYASTPPPAPVARPYAAQASGQAESVPLQHTAIVYDALRHSTDAAPDMPPPSYEQAMAMSGAKGSFV